MNSYLFLPLLFLKFWYVESPREIIAFCLSVNGTFLKLFSLPLLLKTFFTPLKNEYRQGLVRFSKIMGMLVKSVLIIAEIILLLLLVSLELAVFMGFLMFPILTIMLLIW